MTPRDQNLLATLNILVLVFRAQRNKYPKLDEKQQHILQITKEHVAKAGLTIPVFINTLQDLAEKGYLLAANSVFEEKYHADILKVLDDETYQQIQAELQKVDTSKIEEAIKTAAADAIEKTAPMSTQRQNQSESANSSQKHYRTPLCSTGISLKYGTKKSIESHHLLYTLCERDLFASLHKVWLQKHS